MTSPVSFTRRAAHWRRWLPSAAAVVVVALLATGCLTSRSALPGVLRSDLNSNAVTVVETMDVSHTHFFLFWGLAPDAPEDLFRHDIQAAVANAGADGVANVRLEAHYTVVDGIVNMLTMGLLAPRTYRLRGDVVRIAAPPMKGRKLLESAASTSEAGR